MKAAQVSAVAACVWLMSSPAVLDYVDTSAGDIHRTIGPLVGTFGVVALWAATRDVRWVNLALAVTLAAAPLLGGHPTSATVVAVVTAAVLVAATPFGGADGQRRGAGWHGVVAGGEGN